MIQSKKRATTSRLGLLGLCVMAFASMVLSASTAQAEVGAKWLVLTSNGVLKTDLAASFGVEAETTQVMHTKIVGVSVLFECTKVEGVGTTSGSEGKVSGKARYSGCITKLNGVTSAACEPRTGTEKGVITQNASHGLLILFELAGGVKDDIVKVLPDTGETFVTIQMGEECALGEKVPVLGKMTLKDCENLGLTHLVKHLWEVGPGTELWVISKTAEHTITVLGSSWVFLTGAHLGLKFSGDPA